MFEIIIAGNPDACRTEAEITDESGNMVAIVYEDSNGWHTEFLATPQKNLRLRNSRE